MATDVVKVAKDGTPNATTFNMAFQDKDGSGASLAPIHALRDASGNDINPATADGVTALGTSLAGIATNVSTAANQTTTNTTLASILAKQPTSPALEDGGNLAAILTKLGAVVLSAGSAIIGKVGIDQTTPGTTNGVVVNSSVLPTGAALDTSVQQVKTALGSPFQAGGSISNTTFASTQSGQWNITNISGTISLPTGAATAAAQVATQSAPGTAQNGMALTVQGNPAGLPVPTSLAALPALVASSAIIGYAGSLNFQTAPVVPNLSATYASGALLGTAGTAGAGSAIMTVPVFRNTTQPSATLSQILFGWTGSETVNLTAYIFNKLPTTTGLTDTATPTFLAADLQHLVCAPITTTLAAPTAGSTAHLSATSLSLSVQNRDTTVTQNLYVVLVADAAISSAGTNDLFFSISGVQD